MAETKRLLVEASTLPLSVIIIGVGEDRFVGMQELDCDGTMLRDLSGKVAQRDIVQFVDFKQYSKQGMSVLAEAVLKEVPDQLESYMKLKGILPNNFVSQH